MKPFTTIAATVFALVALAHACRLVLGWTVVVAGCALPMWLSLAGLVVAGTLSVLLWREARA